MGSLRQYFKEQLESAAIITDEVYDKIEYKRVWSGKLMEVGDKVLLTLVYPVGDPDYRIMAFLEREFPEIETKFEFAHYAKESIPVLKFKGDTTVRNV